MLFAIDTLDVGGSEFSTLEIARRFADTEAIVCHLYPGCALREEFEEASLPVVSLDVRARYGFVRATTRLLRLVRKVRPDLIQATLFRSRMTARVVATLTRIPLIETFVSDDYGPERRATLDRPARARVDAVRRLDAATRHLAAHRIVISHSVKDAIGDAIGIAPEDCTVIYRGRDVSQFPRRGDPSTSPVRADLGLTAGQRLILAVGRLVPAKDQMTLIRAMPTVLSAHPDVRLFIAGDGPLAGALKEEISRLGLGDHATLLGTRNDVPELLRAADLFVFPSLYEGHGGALVEAMLTGLPIVAADTPVHRESIKCGVSGILATPGDPQSLATGIRRYLDSPEAALAAGNAARSAALERFDIQGVAALHEECYRRAVSRP